MDLRIVISDENSEVLARTVIYQDGSDSEGANEIIEFISQRFVVDPDSASVLDRNKWDDNSIQFSRLLCEIVATQNVDIPALCESMDLEPLDVSAIFERAHIQWEAIKAAD